MPTPFPTTLYDLPTPRLGADLRTFAGFKRVTYDARAVRHVG